MAQQQYINRVLYAKLMFMNKSEHIRIGVLGEDIACRYLESRGFTIKTRNYRKKWGEIDIVAQKDFITYFIEVKSVRKDKISVNPEENLHKSKIKKLFRVFESYALDNNHSLHSPKYNWQFDAVIVRIDIHKKEAQIKHIKNIIVS